MCIDADRQRWLNSNSLIFDDKIWWSIYIKISGLYCRWCNCYLQCFVIAYIRSARIFVNVNLNDFILYLYLFYCIWLNDYINRLKHRKYWCYGNIRRSIVCVADEGHEQHFILSVIIDETKNEILPDCRLQYFSLKNDSFVAVDNINFINICLILKC